MGLDRIREVARRGVSTILHVVSSGSGRAATAPADIVACRVCLHYWTKPTQTALLAEAPRMVRLRGELVIVEDSWSDRPGLPTTLRRR